MAEAGLRDLSSGEIDLSLKFKGLVLESETKGKLLQRPTNFLFLSNASSTLNLGLVPTKTKRSQFAKTTECCHTKTRARVRAHGFKMGNAHSRTQVAPGFRPWLPFLSPLAWSAYPPSRPARQVFMPGNRYHPRKCASLLGLRCLGVKKNGK